MVQVVLIGLSVGLVGFAQCPVGCLLPAEGDVPEPREPETPLRLAVAPPEAERLGPLRYGCQFAAREDTFDRLVRRPERRRQVVLPVLAFVDVREAEICGNVVLVVDADAVEGRTG